MKDRVQRRLEKVYQDTDGKWMSVPPGQQHCVRCHRAQYVDFTVSKSLWRRAVSPKFRNCALCIECFVLEASEHDVELNSYGKDFKRLFVVQP